MCLNHHFSTLPEYIGWVRYISWLMYSNEAMSIVQWQDVHNISKSSLACLKTTKLNILFSSPTACNAVALDAPCLSEGSQVLENYSFAEENLPFDIMAMLVLYLSFHILGYFCLIKRAQRN